jgi:hypothetical protein
MPLLPQPHGCATERLELKADNMLRAGETRAEQEDFARNCHYIPMWRFSTRSQNESTSSISSLRERQPQARN